MAFASWAIWLAADVRGLRSRVETQVGWLIVLSEARDEASRGAPAPVPLDPVLDEMVARFDEEAVRQAVAALRVAVDAGDHDEVAAIIGGELMPRIRRENAVVSRYLGSRWDQVSLLVFVSLCFAVVALGMAMLRQRSEDRLLDAEQRRRLNEERLARVGVGLLAVDASGAVVFANDVVHDLAARQGVSSWWQALVGPVDLPGWVTCRDCGGRARVGRLVATDPGAAGSRSLEMVFGGHAHDLSRAPHQVVLVRDVTEQRRQEARSLLESKLSSLDDLAGGVVHQLNSPLQVVLGTLQLARREAQGEALELVEEALEGARRMSDVVTGLQVLRRDPAASEVAVEEVCSAAQRLVLPLYHGTARLELRVVGGLRVRAEPAQLTAVVHELLRDAVMASVDTPSASTVSLAAFRDGSQVVIEVRDERPAPPHPGPPGRLRQALIDELIAPLGGSLSSQRSGQHTVTTLRLPTRA